MSEEKNKRTENIWDAFNTQPKENQPEKKSQSKPTVHTSIESEAESNSYVQPKEEKSWRPAFQTSRFTLSRGKKIFIVAVLFVVTIGTFVYIDDIDLFSVSSFFYHDKIVTHSPYLQSSKTSYSVDDNVVINLRPDSGFSGLCNIYIAGPDKSFKSYKTTKCEDIENFTISPNELGSKKGQYSILIISDNRRDFVQFERM